MRNRAKCKLCNSIIESFMKGDYVTCTCGEIAVLDGSTMRCAFNDENNFLRLDDEDKEIKITYQEKQQDDQIKQDIETHKPTREEILEMLDEMIKSYEHLPRQALLAPTSHSDHLSLLMLISSLFKSI